MGKQHVRKKPKNLVHRKPKTLLPRQRKFIEAYLRTGNGLKALREAGYSAPNQGAYACKLLRHNELVSKTIREAMEASAVPPEHIIKMLGEVVSGDVTDCITQKGRVNWKATKAKGQIVKRVKVLPGGTGEVELYDKLEAAKLLGKHYGILADRIEVGGAGGGPIRTEYVVQFEVKQVPQASKNGEGNGQQKAIDVPTVVADASKDYEVDCEPKVKTEP